MGSNPAIPTNVALLDCNEIATADSRLRRALDVERPFRFSDEDPPCVKPAGRSSLQSSSLPLAYVSMLPAGVTDVKNATLFCHVS